MVLGLTFRHVAIALIVASFVFSPEVLGAKVEKRVVFPKGKNTVSYRGKLPSEAQYPSYDAYILRAKKGQTLSVKFTTTDPDASFAVYETLELGPMDDAIYSGGADARVWSGKLPIKSEYSVQVYGGETGGAAYTLEITLR